MPFDGCGFFLFLFSSLSIYLISQSQPYRVRQTRLQRGWLLGAGTLFFSASSLGVCIWAGTKHASAASQLADCFRPLESNSVFLGGRLAPTVVAFATGSPGHRWPCAQTRSTHVPDRRSAGFAREPGSSTGLPGAFAATPRSWPLGHRLSLWPEGTAVTSQLYE